MLALLYLTTAQEEATVGVEVYALGMGLVHMYYSGSADNHDECWRMLTLSSSGVSFNLTSLNLTVRLPVVINSYLTSAAQSYRDRL